MKAETLRELVNDDEILVAPGVYDTLTGKIAEDIGFNAIYQGGYATGATTGATEPMASLGDMCDRAREITHNTSTPLIVDGNAGFGNPSHTYRSVQEFANTGIAGMHIEDQVYPKRLHYHAGIKRIVEPDEMVKKIEAAAQARDDINGDIVLIARSDANRGQRRETESIEDAVNRVNQYIDAGAEVGMVFPGDREELEYATNNIDGPFLFTMVESREPVPTIDELDEIGVDIVITAITATLVTAHHMRNMYENLYNDGSPPDIEMETMAELREFVESTIDLPKYYDIEEEAGLK